MEESISMQRVAFLFGAIVVAAVRSWGQAAPIPDGVGAPLVPVLEILDKAKLSGSLAFSGKCVEGHTPELPRFHTPREDEASPVQSVLETAPDQPILHITQEKNGIIRIIEPGVPRDILKVRIAHISFEQPVYTTFWAMHIVLRSPEVEAWLKDHGYRWPLRILTAVGVTGGRDWSHMPHISGSLDNVTVEEAFDYILKTFNGMWVYESCPESVGDRDIYFGFFRLDKHREKPVVVQ
jgi:hypothetical protein